MGLALSIGEKSMILQLNILERIDQVFSSLVSLIERILFFSVAGIPLIILWIITAGVFFTLRMGFINIRGFKHAIDIATTEDEKNDEQGTGEISAFQALATALSASVGLGNIAGVAIAIQMGGPGAVFWMSVTAILGMSIKFVECTLGLKYRILRPDGIIVGGPMYYLDGGLAAIGQAKLGSFLAMLFALFSIPAGLGGGNMFQANQSFAGLTTVFPSLQEYDWLYGLIVALLVGLVIIGGISRIGIVASKLVPFMVTVYLAACLWVVLVNITEIPQAVQVIVTGAFSGQAIAGGFLGVLIQGIRRSVFSNGAGSGTAAIAHAVARTSDPIREGIVAILEPFIDTVVICNLTALVILTNGFYGENAIQYSSGAALAAAAFEKTIHGFSPVLTMIMFLFGFSTMMTWSYYGERCWSYLLGERTVFVFKGLFLACIFLGSIVNLGAVVNFSDMMFLLMSVPNLLGCMLLSGSVATELQIYWADLNKPKKEIKFSKLNRELTTKS
ncbi:alanine/glycine:cation symporter family protein [Gloeothece verrucosa]|uniref:Amino acid carrier protein n=1 Tax=Gloeothece verrucosa (strain PCC 7822) TaxID=497965 RepID=E0UEE8_GLOV7|nr:alanine/glycine:cation symporter family protein [Gloeothece verrucosa]ADN15394.1 amino acid carrier protein [Gloeothece verrucosa PCC 7822]